MQRQRPVIDLAEARDLLRWLKHNGFGAWHLVDAKRPAVIVLFRASGGWMDVVHLRGDDRVEAARMPRSEAADIFRPQKIIWHYFGGVVASISALQELVQRGVGPGLSLYEPPCDGDPQPLYITDSELREKKAFYPPFDVSAEEEPPWPNG